MKAPDASEDQIQAAIIDWLALLPDVIAFHVPNEGKRSKSAGGRQKRLGLVAGAPDIVVLYRHKPRLADRWLSRRTLLIEVKSRTGRQSKEQKDFQAACEDIGHEYLIARSLDDVMGWFSKASARAGT